MPEVTADLVFHDTVIAELVGSYLDDKIREYDFRNDIANVISSSDALCSDVIENMDYSCVIEGVTEEIRHNYMDEVAESMVEDFTNSVVDNEGFMEALHEKIEQYLDETVMTRVNELAKRLANAERAIVELRTQVSAASKPFWRRWM